MIRVFWKSSGNLGNLRKIPQLDQFEPNIFGSQMTITTSQQGHIQNNSHA